ncbi:Elongator subunit elp4 [Haplosporangium sp. Z 11]|nr:Elongator subunit elp4 [Haplosporangium sp. Z 11]
MERRITRRLSAVADAASAATPSPTGTERGRGRGRAGRSRGRPRSGTHGTTRGTGSSRSRPRGRGVRRPRGRGRGRERADLGEQQEENSQHSLEDEMEDEHEALHEYANGMELDSTSEDDSNEEHGHKQSQEHAAMSVDTVSTPQRRSSVRLRSMDHEPADRSMDQEQGPGIEVKSTSISDPNPDPDQDPDQEPDPDTGGSSSTEAFEEISGLPFISPSFPPKLADESDDVEAQPLHEDTPHTSSTISASDRGFFLNEDIYNRVSAGGTGRIAEIYFGKGRRNGSPPVQGSGSSKSRKRRASSTLVVPNRKPAPITPTEIIKKTTQSQLTIPSVDRHGSSSSSTSTTTIVPGNRFDITDLVASVTSYVPEIASALHSVQIKPPDQKGSSVQQSQEQQYSQQHLVPVKPATVRYLHPCIQSYVSRSILTREEHRRYVVYEAITRDQHKNKNLPVLGPEDRAVWTALQEKVEKERAALRQWIVEVSRSQISSLYNPEIRNALETKFKRARVRITDEYPRYYEFVHSVGLLLPGVPSGSKTEPMLSRKTPNNTTVSSSKGSSTTAPKVAPGPHGLLRRTGKICPVSLAKPTWPTDENGVPFEKTIDIDSRYWDSSGRFATSASSSTTPIRRPRLGEQDFRRNHIPKKSVAVSIAKDPVVKEFVKEQNVHIALASSAMVALAKTLPHLAREWEIPVKVVLEEDDKGVMQKRIYVDKPLIPKRMTPLELTQMFYDGVLKKQAVIGSLSTDVSILSQTQHETSTKVPTPARGKQSGGDGVVTSTVQSSRQHKEPRGVGEGEGNIKSSPEEKATTKKNGNNAPSTEDEKPNVLEDINKNVANDSTTADTDAKLQDEASVSTTEGTTTVKNETRQSNTEQETSTLPKAGLQDETNKASIEDVVVVEAKNDSDEADPAKEMATTNEGLSLSIDDKSLFGDDSDSDGDSNEGHLGSESTQPLEDECFNDNFEYSLWTFGEMRLLIRNRLHGYLNNTTPCRQVVLKAILDYAPDIGITEPSKSTMAGWWMATWIRDDRLVGLARVDVSENKFVRYPDNLVPQPHDVMNPFRPLGGLFSDLPAIKIQDTSALKHHDRDIRDWIKPNMRLIHYVLGKLMPLQPGQYIIGHKRYDINANIYKAVQEDTGEPLASDMPTGDQATASRKEGVSNVGRGWYDLHTAHQSSPQMLNDNYSEGGGNTSASTSSGAVGGGGAGAGGEPDEDLLLRWIGTPDQIPGTFPYDDTEPEGSSVPSSPQNEHDHHYQHHQSNRGRGRGARGRARDRGRGRGRGRGHAPNDLEVAQQAAMTSTPSFKKRVPSAQASLPAGCRLSAYNGQVLISTGVPSLDDILGGGLPVGTILLIQEDRQTSYGQLLLKYFLRQGIVAGDKCVVVSGDEPPEAIVRSLMGIAGEESSASQVQQGVDNRDDEEEERRQRRRTKLGTQAAEDEDSEQDRLTIAWRYSGLKKFESGVEARPPAISSRVNKGTSASEPALTPSQIPFCEQFDLTTRISAKALESADTTLIDSGELLKSMNRQSNNKDSGIDSGDSDTEDDEDVSGKNQPDLYRNVLDKLRETIIHGGFSTTLVKDPSAPTPTPSAAGLADRHICRIGINSIASPSWRSKTPQDLYKFLHALRGLLRFSFGAAVITIPAHLYGTIDQRHATDGSTTSPYIHRLEQLCDASVRIESFAGAQTNASSAASAYHGLFHVHKVPVLNALIPSSTKLSVLLDGAAKGSGGPSGSGHGRSSKGVNNLGFKVRRKRFAIETFHLPPEGGVGQRRTSAEPSGASTSLSDRKSGASSSSSQSSSSNSSSASSSTGTRGSSSGSLKKPSTTERRALGGSKVDVHSVPGASGMARKMMGLPPAGIQGAVASGCSSGGSESGGGHKHSHGQSSVAQLGASNNSLLDF